MTPVWVLLAICGGCSVYYYKRSGYILQLGSYFNLLAAVYMGLGLILWGWETGQQFTGEIDQIGWMSIAAVGGFNLAYSLAGFRQSTGPAHGLGSGYLPSHTTMLFVVGVAMIFKLSAIFLLGGLDFFYINRLERFAILDFANPAVLCR